MPNPRRSVNTVNKSRIISRILFPDQVDPKTFVPSANYGFQGCIIWAGSFSRKNDRPWLKVIKTNRRYNWTTAVRAAWTIWRPEHKLDSDEIIVNVCGRHECISLDPMHNKPVPRTEAYRYFQSDYEQPIRTEQGPHGTRVIFSSGKKKPRGWLNQPSESPKPKAAKRAIPTEEEFMASSDSDPE